MALFESTLILMLIAIVLLQISRRLTIPYPTMLATAGVIVAAFPWAPNISIDPKLALALFIAPALLDAGYDFPPRSLRRYWRPLLALAGAAVIVTTAAVAWAGVAIAGMPIAAAIALGAIVAPPDAAAATAMLSRLPSLPRSTVEVLKGESLLNDAVALLIFAAAVGAVSKGFSFASAIPMYALAVPGGLVLGFVVARIYIVLAPNLAGTLGGRLFEFITVFGTWIIADRLHLSAILAVVTLAMTLAQRMPERQAARDRVSSYSIWAAVVFVLNVLAFLLMGLQARTIVTTLDSGRLGDALAFAGIVLAIVIVVRIVCVMLYNRAINILYARKGKSGAPTPAQGIVVSWCGMRGLVTLATALALPESFPARDLIVLSALAVVLGTLILQGLTLGPLIRRLTFPIDHSFDKELSRARVALIDAALESLGDRDGHAVDAFRKDLNIKRSFAADGKNPAEVAETYELRRRMIRAQREQLAALRRRGEVEDDVFHVLEQELDWAELAATQSGELVEG